MQVATNTFYEEESHETPEVSGRGPMQETSDGGVGKDELVPAVSDPNDIPPPQPSSSSSSNQKRTGYVCIYTQCSIKCFALCVVKSATFTIYTV